MLLLVQIDDRSGEVLGHALDELMAMGARNVQLLSSHTKKGRPGNVLLIDLEDGLEPEVAVYLAAELGAWGYHALEARRRHFDVELHERLVTVACGRRSGGRSPCPASIFSREGRLLRVKVERSDVEAIQRFVRTIADACSSDTVRLRLEHELRRNPGQQELEVRLA